MSPRAIPFGLLAVASTAAGLVLSRLSEQQLQSAAKAAGCSITTIAIAARFIGGRP